MRKSATPPGCTDVLFRFMILAIAFLCGIIFTLLQFATLWFLIPDPDRHFIGMTILSTRALCYAIIAIDPDSHCGTAVRWTLADKIS